MLFPLALWAESVPFLREAFSPATVFSQNPFPRAEPEAFQWKPALGQSLLFTGIQHAGRMAQKNTRANLRGPFWNDGSNMR